MLEPEIVGKRENLFYEADVEFPVFVLKGGGNVQKEGMYR